MARAEWPDASKRSVVGRPTSRIDGPVKATGAAKYTYDIQRANMLYAKVAYARFAASKVVDIDTSAAEALPGVKAVWKEADAIGKETQYAGQILAAVAAETEEIAAEAARRIRIVEEPGTPQVRDDDPALADKKPSSRDIGRVEEGYAAADQVVEGRYGLPVITHCCLEAHGQVAEFQGQDLYIWASTQAVSSYADQLGESVGVPDANIHVECQYMGGGFGSKFSYDKWGVIGAQLAKQTGRPVKLMLDRDVELMAAGNRPSAYADVKVGVKRDGTITVFEATIWGTGGPGGYRPPQVPYVFTRIPNQRVNGSGISTHRGGQRAWRAPGHPQACLLTMAALEDAAAAIGMDALEFFLKNLELAEPAKRDVYRKELEIAADLIGYKEKAHLRTQLTPGPLKRGLGISLHMWGGLGHPSNCDVTLYPDGSVEVKIGTQDLGTGTRTVIAMVVAETLGVPVEAVTVKMGSNAYPESGASGGSTTVGGVSASSRFAATEAFNQLAALVSHELGVAPEDLEARNGRIHVAQSPDKYMSWRDACGLLQGRPLTARGQNNIVESQPRHIIDAGVCGVQMADVTVDVETGVVRLNEMVAVQDCGLVINPKTAESQVYGGMIMGITYALFEEAVYDPTTGVMLNADMEFYRLAGYADIGRLKVHLMTGPGFDDRGVIGLGEPPVISPGAAISNAVANAVGVRVPYLPLTPDRVLAALHPGGFTV